MDIKGKKINFLGDSITEGVGVSSVDATYWKVMCKNESVGIARGYGISGTRYAKQRHPETDNPKFDNEFCKRIHELDTDADIVVIFGGTNDFGHGDAPVGDPSDRTPDTFWGACHYLYSTAIERFPEALIVIMTPLHRLSEDKIRGDRNKTEDVIGGLKRYVEIIKEVAEYYSLPVLDLWSVSGIQPKLDIIREKYCPDGLHPNDAGHVIIADRLAGFLKSL